ncbi:MAG: hypothetical protein IT379_23240 [Deltaproteobacteria bacterium]|nr:hypothetical protein [Deltaproteobacteria bacterium]
MARVSDVWRCHAPTSVVIETRGDEWWSPLETAGTRAATTRSAREWIVVERRTGAMRVETDRKTRRER